MEKLKKIITHKIVWLPIAIGFVLILLIQLLWPSSRVRPLTYWGDTSVSARSVTEVGQICRDKTEQSQVTIKAEMGDSKTIFKPTDISTQFDCDKFANNAASYPLRKKIIPLSIFVRQTTENPRLMVVKQDEFLKKSDEIAKRLTVVPRNATLVISDGVIVEKDSMHGMRYDGSKLAPQLLALEWPQPSATTVRGEKTEAPISKNSLADTKKQLQAKLGDGFMLTNKKKRFRVEPKQVGLWMSVQTEGRQKPELLYYGEAITKYLKDNQEPLKKQLSLKSIDSDRSSKAIVDALQKDSPESQLFELPVASPKSPIDATPVSIANYIKQLETKGESISVYVKKIGGGIQYGTNSDKVYTSASTYKLFVAYSVMKRVDAGQLAWSSPINGTSVEICFEKMIVKSDNACPEAFLKQFGYGAVQAEARAIGASQTSIVPGNMRTSPQSLGVLLEKLGNGSLVSADSTNRALGLMRRQIFRKGIPSGTSYLVADKVGFLDALLHDAAVVEAPQGKYVVVVMTDHSTWGRIAELTRMIVSTF